MAEKIKVVDGDKKVLVQWYLPVKLRDRVLADAKAAEPKVTTSAMFEHIVREFYKQKDAT